VSGGAVEGLDQLFLVIIVAQKIELFGKELLDDHSLGQHQILHHIRSETMEEG